MGKAAPERGGIPTFLQTLLDSRLSAVHELTLLNLARAGGRQGGQLTWRNVSRTVADAWLLWRQAPAHDVVHLHSALAPLTTVLRAGLLTAVAHLRGARVVVHAHGGRLQLWCTTRGRRLLTRLALRPAHRVVAVAGGGHGTLDGLVSSRRLRLIANGVNADRFRPSGGSHHPPTVLYVGLLTPRKGVLDLLKASRMLLDEGVEHRLLLVGGAPDEGGDAESRVRAAAAGHAAVLDPRPHEEMPAVYAEGDVFCLPSWWEAMPLSLLEAAACGLPVVATAVGDIPRMVQDGVSGSLVAPRDPVALASALRRYLEDSQARQAGGAAARRNVEEHFSLEETTAALDALYTELVTD